MSRFNGNQDPFRDVLYAFWKGIGTPHALACWMMYKYGEHKQLAALRASPLGYNDANDFASDYAASSFLSKYSGLKTGIDTRAVALEAFDRAESFNKHTNSLFELRRAGSVSFRPAVEHVLSRAAQKIARVLEGWSVSEAFEACRFGPGATHAVGREVGLWDKTRSLSVTRSATTYAWYLYTDPVRFEALSGVKPDGPYSLYLPFDLIEGNKQAVVPKNAKTDRTICIEPSLNIELQLGVGAMIRSRLRKFAGIDLDDQTRNQRLARESYSHGYATLDLSMASDSLTCGLVLDLLPIDFFELLNAIRSKCTLTSRGWEKQEKFASMGNGFCFELETLIFWAISSSAAGWAAVYGDDIICDSNRADFVVECLTAIGFKINSDKSYLRGNFFESCGKHYFKGVDVTPVYQKEEVTDEPSAIRLINRIRRLGFNLGLGFYCDARLRAPWARAIELYYGGRNPSNVQPLVDASGVLYQGDFGVALTKTELESTSTTGLWPVLCKGLVNSPTLSGKEFQTELYAFALRANHKRSRLPRDGTILTDGVALRQRERYRRKTVAYFLGTSDVLWL